MTEIVIKDCEILDEIFRTPSKRGSQISQSLNDYLDDEVLGINSRPMSSMEEKLKQIIKDNSNF